MTVIDLKNKLEQNNIDVFSFSIQNKINPIHILNAEDDVVISEQLKTTLNNYLRQVDNNESLFLDSAKSNGLKIENNRLTVNLDSKKQTFHLEIDASMLSKIDFL